MLLFSYGQEVGGLPGACTNSNPPGFEEKAWMLKVSHVPSAGVFHDG